MKKLFIILFITGIACGQNKSMLMNWYSAYGETLTTKIDTIQPIKPPKEYLTIALPKYWDEYKKSLDSKYSKEIKDKFDSCIDDEMQFSVSYLGADTVVFKYGGEFRFFRPRHVVRERPSFEGFIEYLRRKQ